MLQEKLQEESLENFQEEFLQEIQDEYTELKEEFQEKLLLKEFIEKSQETQTSVRKTSSH